MTSEMKLSEFVDLLDAADAAYASDDRKAINAINQRLAQIGYQVIERDGKVWVQMMRPTRPLLYRKENE